MNHYEPHLNNDSADWRYQQFESTRLRLRWSLVLNSVLFGLLGLSLALLFILLPLKQTVPYVISLNESTGEMSQVGELTPASIENKKLLTRYFILRYIQNRESYHADSLDRPYQIAYAMSAPNVAEMYAKEVNTQNNDSPFQRYGKDKFVTVAVKSVAWLNGNTAEVHFEKILHEHLNDKVTHMPMVAILKWDYQPQKTTLKILDRNPLGFKVIYYQPTPVI